MLLRGFTPLEGIIVCALLRKKGIDDILVRREQSQSGTCPPSLRVNSSEKYYILCSIYFACFPGYLNYVLYRKDCIFDGSKILTTDLMSSTYKLSSTPCLCIQPCSTTTINKYPACPAQASCRMLVLLGLLCAPSSCRFFHSRAVMSSNSSV